MIVISNQQRDEIVRFLNEYSGVIDTKRTRGYNTRRIIRKLTQALEVKRPFPVFELPEQLRKCR